MKKLVYLALIVGAYYAHSRFVFSDDALQRWVAQHAARAMAGEQSACDDYSDAVNVNIHAEDQQGSWEVEGGKSEVCGYMKQASAAFTVLQASTNITYENFKVERTGFPWLEAKVSYEEHTSVSAAMIPAMTAISNDTLVLKRGLSGLKIVSITADSNTEI